MCKYEGLTNSQKPQGRQAWQHMSEILVPLQQDERHKWEPTEAAAYGPVSNRGGEGLDPNLP